jgi:YggT family protein
MLSQIYSIISLIVMAATAVFVALLLLRLIFSYADPNPFGAVGRFGFKVRKITERFVYPSARLLARFGVNVRFAPLITIFVAIVIAYFTLGIISTTLFVVGGLADSIADGNIKTFVGFVLYGLISIYILFIFIRFLSSWFVFARNTFLGFVQRVTDPVLLPARRIIPTIGMFDISAMLVLILLQFLQTIVLRIFVYS